MGQKGSAFDQWRVASGEWRTTGPLLFHSSLVTGHWPLCLVLFGILLGSGVVGAAEQATPEKKREPFRYDLAGHRDPFVPLVQNGKVLTGPGAGGQGGGVKPVLHGILWDPGGQSLALINDGEVKVGDTIGGYRVDQIRQDAVVLSNGGESLTLQMLFDISPKVSPKKNVRGGEEP